ncbi:MAG: selenocysteine lyase, partial [Bacteroidota bacterium]|nr:selenocysteine lyase [Bacteroidota bacterium]
VRGGCACAGTYGHYMLHVSKEDSQNITDLINSGDLSKKPGWVRWSIHPTTKDSEIDYFIKAVKEIVENYKEWSKEYYYDKTNNEFFNINSDADSQFDIKNWFSFD